MRRSSISVVTRGAPVNDYTRSVFQVGLACLAESQVRRIALKSRQGFMAHDLAGTQAMMQGITSALSDWIVHLLAAVSLVDVCWVLAAMLVIHVCRYAGIWIYAVIALPGTFAHEVAHFVVALILGARPSFPSMIPTRTERGWRLGSVAFRVGHLRALPIALAPLLLAPLSAWWAGWFLHPASWPLYAVHVWIVAAMATASLPSATDWKLALPALSVVAAIALIAAIGWTVWQ
jgi:hypothetical protein